MTIAYFYIHSSFESMITSVKIIKDNIIVYDDYYNNMPGTLKLKCFKRVTYNCLIDEIVFEIY